MPCVLIFHRTRSCSGPGAVRKVHRPLSWHRSAQRVVAVGTARLHPSAPLAPHPFTSHPLPAHQPYYPSHRPTSLVRPPLCVRWTLRGAGRRSPRAVLPRGRRWVERPPSPAGGCCWWDLRAWHFGARWCGALHSKSPLICICALAWSRGAVQGRQTGTGHCAALLPAAASKVGGLAGKLCCGKSALPYLTRSAALLMQLGWCWGGGNPRPPRPKCALASVALFSPPTRSLAWLVRVCGSRRGPRVKRALRRTMVKHLFPCARWLGRRSASTGWSGALGVPFKCTRRGVGRTDKDRCGPQAS